MRERPVSTWAITVAILTAIGLETASAQPTDPNDAVSTIGLFEIADAGLSRVTDMVIDPGGSPWVMAANRVFFWTGAEFREPLSGSLSSGVYLTQLYGGPDRGAYMTQEGENEHEGFLYKLENGAASFVTTFYYEVSYRYPGIYVSKDGRLFNWGDQFLAVYDGGEWSRIEARLSLERSIVFDRGDEVCFYYDSALYCVTASGELQERACPPWVKSRPGQNRIVGALWARDNALLVNSEEGLFAFSLVTGEEIDLGGEEADWQDITFLDVFSLRDGGVWILGHRYGVSYSFFHLSPSGELSEVVAMRALKWDSSRCWQYPESVVETADGALLFGLPYDGIAVFRDNSLTHWGWEYGFADGVARIHEDPSGNLWLPDNGRIARLRLDDDPPALDPSILDWEEVALIRNSHMWELGDHQLAVFRADQPGRLSRWDGWNWNHQKVPFDTAKTRRSASDDRGHLLIEPLAGPDGCFDVGPDSVQRFDGTKPMLAAAVAAGAREFRSDDEYQGIVVTPDGRIWFGYSSYNLIYHYDGVRWNEIFVQSGPRYLFSSAKYGILISNQAGRFCRYELGQMVEVGLPVSQTRELLIGEKHLQPYERELIDLQPGRYFPIFRDIERMILFFEADEFEASMDKGEAQRNAVSVVVPRFTEHISVAASGGAWVFGMWGSASPSRLFGEGVYPIEVAGTPLAGKPILDIKEDPAGGLWFLTQYAGQTVAYHHDLPRIELRGGPVPDTCGRELVVNVSILPERLAPGTRIFSRVDNGVWAPAGPAAEHCSFRFSTSGEHDCEITALRMGGRIDRDLSFRIRADVSAPLVN